MGATLMAPIAGSSQMLGTTGAVANPDVHAVIELDLALQAGTEVRPTQPPHPSLIVDVRSGYPENVCGVSYLYVRIYRRYRWRPSRLKSFNCLVRLGYIFCLRCTVGVEFFCGDLRYVQLAGAGRQGSDQ